MLLTTVIQNIELSLGNRFVYADGDLILADVHLGKTMHFRKAGFAIPMEARKTDQSALFLLLKNLCPKRVIILGDLFHSDANTEVAELEAITSQFQEIGFVLVKGNHDVMPDAIYRTLDMETCNRMVWKNFLLTHEPVVDLPLDGLINMHGHIHPGAAMQGAGKQRLLVPCFHLYNHHFCLPAFGSLTGLMRIKPRKNDTVFGIVEGEVIRLY